MIHMGVARHGYVGLVRTADGNLHVAAAVDPAALRSDGGPEQLINRILSDADMSTLSGLTAHACRGTLPLTRSSGRLTDNRVFLLGDAAGYVEPFTGEGMGWAMASAVSVVPYVMNMLKGWDAMRATEWERASSGKWRGVSWPAASCQDCSLPVGRRSGTRRPAHFPVRGPSNSAAYSSGASTCRNELVMNVAITGIGTAVPEHQIEQNDAAAQAAEICGQTQVQQRLVKTLYRRAGVRTRHSVVLDSDTNGRSAEQSFYTRTAQGPTTAERMIAYDNFATPLAIEATRGRSQAPACPPPN